MLLDLLSSDNYGTYNVKVAQIMGLHTAIYLAEIININRKAINKEKIDNNCFTINRQYIENRTTIDTEEQLKIDKKLSEVGILGMNVDNPDQVYIDVNALTNMIAAGDAKLLERVSRITKLKYVGDMRVGKMTQRQRDAANCKTAISTTNGELLDALSGWVDAVFARPNGFLSKRAVTIFQNELYKYTNGDLDLALKLVDIATVGGYRDFQWAKEEFESRFADTFRRQYSQVAPVKRKTVDSTGEVF